LPNQSDSDGNLLWNSIVSLTWFFIYLR